MIRKGRLVDAVSRATDQHKAPVAIAAVDITMLVDLEEHAWMAERGATGNVAGAVTDDTIVADTKGFGRGDHEARIARWDEEHNSSYRFTVPPSACERACSKAIHMRPVQALP